MLIFSISGLTYLDRDKGEEEEEEEEAQTSSPACGQGPSARKTSKTGVLLTVCSYLCLSLDFVLNPPHSNKFGLSSTIPQIANRSSCSSSSLAAQV